MNGVGDVRAPAAHLGQTLAQKLIAKACGRTRVTPGEIVSCRVDLAMFHDSSGPRRLKPMLDELGADIWDPARVVLVMDHYVPESDDSSRRIVQVARDWAAEVGLTKVHDSVGICHVVLPEQGHLAPGMFCVGGDSHSPTAGAFGAFMFGIGSTEMLGVLVTGEIWVKVPGTIRMQWDGPLAPGVCAKDMALSMLGRFGMNGGRYQAIEYAGSTIAGLSMAERMTLCNMTAESGAQVGLVAPDLVTKAWLEAAGRHDVELDRWQSDADAPLLEHHGFDATRLAPQVARPHSPANTSSIDEVSDVKIDMAYIGACTGAKLEDLQAAASVFKRGRIAAGLQVLVAPASTRTQRQAEADGSMQILRDAGVRILPTGCGACAGYGSQIPDHAVVLSTTARNFKGRMGGEGSEVYLASPYTVAASALRGRITDPREMLG